MQPGDGEVTNLLEGASAGVPGAADRLFVVLHDELRSLARAQMADERAGHTLQATALVNEAWLRLGGSERTWQGRSQFLAAAARAMRRVLVDHARGRDAQKRAGERERVPLDEALASFEVEHLDVIAVDEALTELARRDAEVARIVELRFFAGLTSEDAARVVGISVWQAENAWALGRAFLSRRLRAGEP